MALVGNTLYVANADALVAFPYTPGATRIDAAPRKIADLPAGRNHHWTKSLVASPDGSRLYVGVGSNSNVAEHGMDEEVNRAAILEIDPATGATRVFATGLRNPVGMDWNPESGAAVGGGQRARRDRQRPRARLHDQRAAAAAITAGRGAITARLSTRG